MRSRRLGRSGPAISEISLGSYRTYGTRLDLERSRRCIRRALDLGINTFDTADVYGDGESERILGRVLGEVDRDEWLIATKCYFPWPGTPTRRGLSRSHIFEAVDRSLSNLGVERIDLLQCHRFDVETSLEETTAAMDDLVAGGKVRFWGIGRCGAEQIDAVVAAAEAAGHARPVSHQTAYNLLHRGVERQVLDAGARHGIGTIAYGVLAQGVLTGKYGEGEIPAGSRAADPGCRDEMYHWTAEDLLRTQRLRSVADEAGLTLAQMSIAWCLRQDALASAVVGATRPEQLDELAGASGVTLSARQRSAVDRALAAPDAADRPS